MHESPVGSVAHPPDETLLDQCVGEIARGRLMQRHASRESVDAHALLAGNLRESPQLRAGDRYGPSHLRIVPSGGGVDEAQVLQRLKLSDVSPRARRSVTGLNATLRLPIGAARTNTGWPASLRGRGALHLHSVTHA